MGALMPVVYNNATGHDIYEALLSIHLGAEPKYPDPFELKAAVSGRCLAARRGGVASKTMNLSWLRRSVIT